MAEATSDSPSNADDAGDAIDRTQPAPERLSDDEAPPLAAPYPQAAADAMPPALRDEDRRTGRVIAILLTGLFAYTILAMGYVVYLTYQWTTAG